jgi:hypothetical protein
LRAREWCARGKWGKGIAGKGIWWYAILAGEGDCGQSVGTGGCGQAGLARRERGPGTENGLVWIPASRPGFSCRTFPCPQFACPEKRRSRFPCLSFCRLCKRPFCCCPDAWHGGRQRPLENGSSKLRRAAPVARLIPSEPRNRLFQHQQKVMSRPGFCVRSSQRSSPDRMTSQM